MPHPLSGLKVDHKCSSAHPFNVLPIITTHSSFPYARQQTRATKTLKVNKLCRYNKYTKVCEIPQFVFRSNDKSDVTDNCHWWQSYLEREVSELCSLLRTWAPALDSTGRRVGANAHAQIEPPTKMRSRRRWWEGGITSLDLNEHWTRLHPNYRVTIKEIDTFNMLLKRNY